MEGFKLNDKFLKEYKTKTPDFGDLGLVTYSRTYARTKDDGSQEQFWETVKRVVEGCYAIQKDHCRHLGVEWNNDKAQRSAQEMYRRMFDMLFLPPGRGLWSMGSSAAERAPMSLFNCAYVSCADLKTDLAEPFCWSMESLMLGVGVGFSSKGSTSVQIKEPKLGEHVFEVPDTREGWVDALRAVITPFSGKGSLPASFDLSKVRAHGEPIKGFGGVASGPAPLQELLEDVKNILNTSVGKPFSTTAVNDIMNLIGRCVVAGNVRRSAELSLGDSDDDEFLNLKNPDLFPEELMHHRWASNNSVFAKKGMDYSRLADLASKNGEPGMIWLDNCQQFSRMKDPADGKDYRVAGINPCGEMTLESYEVCNICEIFPARHESKEDYLKTLKYAYLYAKTVTLLRTHSVRTNAIMQRNRRVGCSMSGIVQAVQKFGRRAFFDMCDDGYKYLKELDREYSDWMCIPKSVKMTTVKPSGTVSLLPGATSGIHFAHSEYYIRRIRFQANSKMLEKLAANGYPMEPDAYSPNTTVVSFPVKEKYFDRSKTDVTMWEQLELAAQMQHYWADNSVSVTVTVKPEELKDIKYALEMYETRLKTVSFLPLSEHGYVQAPFETITKEQYEELAARVTPITSFTDDTHEITERFCTGDTCMI